MTTIRLARFSDIENFIAAQGKDLTFKLSPTKYWVIVPNSESLAEAEDVKWLRKIRNPDAIVAIATYNNKVIATATLTAKRDGQKISSQITEFILFDKDINTAQNLLDYLISKAKENGHEKVSISVNSQDSKTLKLLSSKKFVEAERNEVDNSKKVNYTLVLNRTYIPRA